MIAVIVVWLVLVWFLYEMGRCDSEPSLGEWLLSKLPSKTIEHDGAPYLTRYFLFGVDGEAPGDAGKRWFRKFNVFIHHFHTSDQDRGVHNHPWAGWSLILRGGYIEERVEHRYFYRDTQTGEYIAFGRKPLRVRSKVCRPGDWNRLRKDDFHRAVLLDERAGAWTLFFAGERVREWGFLDPQTGVFTPFERNKDAIP